MNKKKARCKTGLPEAWNISFNLIQNQVFHKPCHKRDTAKFYSSFFICVLGF